MGRDEEHAKQDSSDIGFEERVGLAWGARDVEIDPDLRSRMLAYALRARAAGPTAAPAAARPAKKDSDER